MLTTSTTSRRSRTAAGLSLLVLTTLMLATATLLGPEVASAAKDRDRWADQPAAPGGPGGDPGAGLPGDGTNGAPTSENSGVTGVRRGSVL